MTYFTENSIRFAEIPEETLNRLAEVPVGRFTVSSESIGKFKEILGIDKGISDEDLQAIRNGVVYAVASRSEKLRAEENPLYWTYQTMMSAVTAIIDNEKWNRGMAV